MKSKADVSNRRSSTSNENGKDSCIEKPRDRNRESLMYDDDDLNTSIPKLEKIIDKDNERIRLHQEYAKSKKKPTVNQSFTSNDTNRHEKKMEASAQKFKTFLNDDIESIRKKDDKKPTSDLNNTLPRAGTSKASTPPKIEVKTKTPVQSSKRPSSAHSSMDVNSAKKRRPSIVNTKQMNYKPFGKLLEGVVIVISGIQVINYLHSHSKSRISISDSYLFTQNPERADIRDKAQKMGARYKPDWNDSCTHLM